jgi:type IV secretory pathway VirB2 component (pilin)
MMHKRIPSILIPAFTLVAILSIGHVAHATSVTGLPVMASVGPMPWDGILGQVAAAFTGTTGKLIALLGLIICGFMYIMSEGGGVRRLFGIGIGISLVVGAGSLVGMFFNAGSGLTI